MRKGQPVKKQIKRKKMSVKKEEQVFVSKDKKIKRRASKLKEEQEEITITAPTNSYQRVSSRYNFRSL
jgi:hypothetical protein